jgi:cell division septum initiation protein DivIVA
MMTEHTDPLADLGQEEIFEKEMRGYSRRQVDEFVAKARSQARESRDLENRLSHALDENERLRLELSSARQAVSGRPPHEEISERVGQILKLADDEAKSQRKFAAEEIGKLREEAKSETDRMRTEAKQETDKFRAEAQNQAERMLRAAQEQAENSVASARAEAEKTRNAARTEAERSVSEAHKQAETALSSSKAQAKQVLDEATARATAIHDGAERRLNLLMSRHTEAIRRLTEIRDVVTTLVAGEVSRGSLEDEVEKAVANSMAESKAATGGRPAGDGRHAPQGGPAAASQAQAAPQAQGMAAPAQPAPTRGRVEQGRPQTAQAAQTAQPSQAAQPSQPAQAPAPAKPAENAGNGQPAETPARPPAAAPRTGNGQRTEGGDTPRPAGTGEGARHAVGGNRGSEE